MSDMLPAKQPPDDGMLIFQTEDGRTRLEVRFLNESVWLSLNQMADLFQRDKSVIAKQIKNVFEEGELARDPVVAKFATTATDGKTYQVKYFNLDVIIFVGYRVKSRRGTQFRIWATQRLREYLVKGFVLDDERLKESGDGGYFDELLARIRDIRSSEKVFWRRVLDIYATSVDDPGGLEAISRWLSERERVTPAIPTESVGLGMSRPRRGRGRLAPLRGASVIGTRNRWWRLPFGRLTTG